MWGFLRISSPTQPNQTMLWSLRWPVTQRRSPQSSSARMENGLPAHVSPSSSKCTMTSTTCPLKDNLPGVSCPCQPCIPCHDSATSLSTSISTFGRAEELSVSSLVCGFTTSLNMPRCSWDGPPPRSRQSQPSWLLLGGPGVVLDGNMC